MLRASLFAMSFAALAALATDAVAGPHHHPQARLVQRTMTASPGSAAIRQARPVLRPVRPVLVGVQQPFFPYFGSSRTVVVGRAGYAAGPQEVSVTLNTIPVVVGIRRAPEAAPVIYRIADGHEHHRMRRQERRRVAPSAGVHHIAPDTTTPRVIVVRGRP